MSRLTIALNQLMAAALAFAATSAMAKSDTISAVGEISFVVGKASVISASGKAIAAAVGVKVHVSDRIETDAGSSVHVRFVDDELVSVRQGSTLEIQRYDYSPQNPQDSAIKLNLLEGTSRAISGKGAQAARQNFRLNTPIAAIGVRGTDFVVNASSRTVSAMVNEGAIVVSPFSMQCSAEALGPCSQEGVELSGLSRQILQLNATRTGVASTLLPASGGEVQALVAEATAKSATAKGADTKDTETKGLYAETVTTKAVTTVLASSEPVRATEPVIQPPVVVAVIPEFTPDTAESVKTLTSSAQLVWGRWYERNLDSERITVSYETATADKRQATVGNLSYALFRVEPDGQIIKPGLGALAFNLVKAQAFYRGNGKLELMDVNGGELALDFNQARFSTSLQLNHSATGQLSFVDSGNIYSGGFFHSNGASQSMAGAVSVDGKEAGYFFEKSLEHGSIEGLTLWGQKP